MIADGFVRLHADAAAVLAGWEPREPQQRVLREEYRAFLREHPDAMSRECRLGHLTSSALVMDEDRTRVLLTLHSKVGRWLQLGGHNEVGDGTIRHAAHREAVEESGIADVTVVGGPLRLDRHPVPCGGSMSEHLDVQYLAVVPSAAVAVMSDESDDLQWFELEALPDPLDASVRALINAAVNSR